MITPQEQMQSLPKVQQYRDALQLFKVSNCSAEYLMKEAWMRKPNSSDLGSLYVCAVAACILELRIWKKKILKISYWWKLEGNVQRGLVWIASHAVDGGYWITEYAKLWLCKKKKKKKKMRPGSMVLLSNAFQ